jgi:hypothetical protein
VNYQAGSYTLVASDVGKIVIMTSTTPVNLTVPVGLGLGEGNRIDILQYGTGKVTVVPSSGVSVNTSLGLNFRARYSSATLLCITTNAYILIGDITSA